MSTKLYYQLRYGGVRTADGRYRTLRAGESVNRDDVHPDHLDKYLRRALKPTAPGDAALGEDDDPNALPTPAPGQVAEFEQEPLAPVPPRATRPAGAAFDAASASDVELISYIRENELKPGDTVKLAGDDPELAERLLQAESAATDGSPREWVVTRLQKIVDATDADGDSDD